MQIYHAKSFKLKYFSSLYLNFIPVTIALVEKCMHCKYINSYRRPKAGNDLCMVQCHWHFRNLFSTSLVVACSQKESKKFCSRRCKKSPLKCVVQQKLIVFYNTNYLQAVKWKRKYQLTKSIKFVETICTPKIQQSSIGYTGLLGRWDKWLIDQASDAPSMIFFTIVSCKVLCKNCFNIFSYFFHNFAIKCFRVP